MVKSVRRKSLLPIGAYIKKLMKMVIIVSSMILPELLKEAVLTYVFVSSLVSFVFDNTLIDFRDYASSLSKYRDKLILTAF